MRRIIRLTENDLTKLVKRVIKEDEDDFNFYKEKIDWQTEKIKDNLNRIKDLNDELEYLNKELKISENQLRKRKNEIEDGTRALDETQKKELLNAINKLIKLATQ
jgi:chromosome segregation ATPase